MYMKQTILRTSGAARRIASPRNASSLVIAEHDNSSISVGTLAAITAANQISAGNVTVLIPGSGIDGVATNAAKVAGVTKVLSVDNAALKNPVAEPLANVVSSLANTGAFSHVIASASNVSKNYLPRAAALCDSAPLTDVSAVVSEDTFQRPMYAGNAVSTVQMSDKTKFIVIRPTSFDKAEVEGGSAAVEAVEAAVGTGPAATFVSESVAKSDRPDLTAASIVVAGGRALKSEENFGLIFDLADKLKGAVGASRAAVDAGYISNEHQVGQTGKVVAPDLYIAAGISGAIQHLSGMKDSKVIVAVNKDKEAPIFSIADYGLVDDLFTAIPDITNKL